TAFLSTGLTTENAENAEKMRVTLWADRESAPRATGPRSGPRDKKIVENTTTWRQFVCVFDDFFVACRTGYAGRPSRAQRALRLLFFVIFVSLRAFVVPAQNVAIGFSGKPVPPGTGPADAV